MDEIEKDGAEMLVTKYIESEIAFAVTGRDIKSAGHKFAMVERPYDHGTYIGAIPRGFFREQVLDHCAIDGYGEHYQTKDQVMYERSTRLPFKQTEHFQAANRPSRGQQRHCRHDLSVRRLPAGLHLFTVQAHDCIVDRQCSQCSP